MDAGKLFFSTAPFNKILDRVTFVLQHVDDPAATNSRTLIPYVFGTTPLAISLPIVQQVYGGAYVDTLLYWRMFASICHDQEHDLPSFNVLSIVSCADGTFNVVAASMWAPCNHVQFNGVDDDFVMQMLDRINASDYTLLDMARTTKKHHDIMVIKKQVKQLSKLVETMPTTNFIDSVIVAMSKKRLNTHLDSLTAYE